jgi:hypothetical protein
MISEYLRRSGRMVNIRKEILDEVRNRLRNDLFRCEVTVCTRSKTQKLIRGIAYDYTVSGMKTDIPEGSEHEKRDFPYVKIGEWFTINLFSRRSGYVHVFNLGSSGSVKKMFPAGAGVSGKAANRITADIPLLVSNYFGNPDWEEKGPDSTVAGNPEGLLFVLTKNDITLHEQHLHIDLNRYVAKGMRGGLGDESQGVSDLYSKPEEEVVFGYYKFEVMRE